jgi:hypothetical protein
MADVEVLTQQITHLSKLGQEFGSGRVREQVVVLLHREANQLLHGSYSEKTGKALLSGVAQATRLAGYMSADGGRDALAQRYYIQALDLAMQAGDRLFGPVGSGQRGAPGGAHSPAGLRVGTPRR